jgi:hypothetical protein
MMHKTFQLPVAKTLFSSCNTIVKYLLSLNLMTANKLTLVDMKKRLNLLSGVHKISNRNLAGTVKNDWIVSK